MTQATTTSDMTPARSVKEHLKRLALRSYRRIAPLAYSKFAGGIRPLTFHYMFPGDRENGEQVFKALKREGDFISTSEMLRLLDAARPITQRLFHVSVDDGFENVLDNAWPIMKSLRIPFSFMVCPKFVGKDSNGLREFIANTGYAHALPMSSWDRLRQADAEGVEIGSHTISHRLMADLSEADLRTEIFDSKAEIERQLGKPCVSFAWPFGRRESITRLGVQICHEARYKAIFSSIRGTVRDWDDAVPYLPRHHFEPDWPVDTVVYYATRKEARFRHAAQHLGAALGVALVAA